MVGANYGRGNWLVGLALTRSSSDSGDYTDTDAVPRPATQACPHAMDAVLCDGAVRAGDGKVAASLTAAIPYGALQVSERLQLWGAVGYGSGEWP